MPIQAHDQFQWELPSLSYVPGMGQSTCSTHLLFLVSTTCPEGHWHLATHERTQNETGLSQVELHADPHSVKTWPVTGQAGQETNAPELA